MAAEIVTTEAKRVTIVDEEFAVLIDMTIDPDQASIFGSQLDFDYSGEDPKTYLTGALFRAVEDVSSPHPIDSELLYGLATQLGQEVVTEAILLTIYEEIDEDSAQAEFLRNIVFQEQFETNTQREARST